MFKKGMSREDAHQVFVVMLNSRYSDSAKIVARTLTRLGFKNSWTVGDGFSGGKGWLQSRLGTDSYKFSFAEVLSPSRIIPAGKDLKDSRVLIDVGDVPIQEIRDCGVDDKRLMSVIGESVKLVMEEAPLRPLVLGGDHSISFPVIRAVSEKLGGPVDVLHIDAHPDNYDAFEGNIYSHASSFARVMEGDYVRRLLQLKDVHKQNEMRTFSRDRPFLENLKLGEGVKGVYISIDVDCLDPAFAPGVSHIEPGGLSFRDVLNILHNLQGDVVAGDVVELNPQRDTVDGMTAMVAAKLVREMAAKIAK
ncbi:hypothetical protein RYX36_029672 [Vicia faba]